MYTYAYLKNEESSFLKNTNFNFIELNGFTILKERIVFEDISVEKRIKFKKLIKHTLKENDLLVINSLDSMGTNFIEIDSTINYIFKKNIRLICLEFSKKEICSNIKIIFLHFLRIASKFERKKITSKNKIIKNKLGRPEILNNNQKKEIIQKFKKGQSIYSLAKQFSVSRTVIKRIISNLESTEIEKY
ncbi:helix-turn-helix domain-containing protein [Acinetobacter sp. CE-15]|uniref:helix-turn-helix domain-containing protein n=1 Tax=Acinetobacter sp. CE-15 TaxID=3425693 RepID=UPI003DA1E1D3